MSQSNRPAFGRDSGTHTVKAIALVAVVVIVGVVLLNHKSTLKATGSSSHAASSKTSHNGGTDTTATTVPPSTTTTTLLAVGSVKVQVLNGVLTGSLSGEWSAKLKASPGYDTLSAENATAKVTASEIYVVTPGYLPDALHLASVVGLSASAVNTTTPPPASAPIPTADLTTANIVLVIGPDLAGSA